MGSPLTKVPLYHFLGAPPAISQRHSGRFLVTFLAISPSPFRTASVNKLEYVLLIAVEAIDRRPIQGEFKLWILMNYLVPSLYFMIVGTAYSRNFLSSVQEMVELASMLYTCKSLPSRCTQNSHSFLTAENKQSCLWSVPWKLPPQEHPDFKNIKQLDIAQNTCLILQPAKESVKSTTSSSFNRQAKDILLKQQVAFWNATLAWPFTSPV